MCGIHEDLTIDARKMHCDHVASLKNQLDLYGVDPFSEDVPKAFSTGTEIPKEVLDNILKAAEIGDAKYKAFVKERLVDGTKLLRSN